MNIKLFLFLFILFSVCTNVIADFGDGGVEDEQQWNPDNPESAPWTDPSFQINTIDPFKQDYLPYVIQAGRQSELIPSQLASINPESLENLGHYSIEAVQSSINAQGFDVDLSGSLEGAVVQGDQLIFEDGSTLDLSTGQTTINNDADGLDITTPTTTIQDAFGVILTDSTLLVTSASTLTDGTTTATSVNNYQSDGTITTIQSSDLITYGTTSIPSAENIQIRETSFGLVIDATSAINTNVLMFDSGVLPVRITLAENDQISAVYDNDKVTFTLPDNVYFEFSDIAGTTEQQTEIQIQQLENAYKVTSKFSSFTFNNYIINEQVLSKELTIFEFNKDYGVYELALGKDSRYAYKDLRENGIAFYILNPEIEPYTIHINKENRPSISPTKALITLPNDFQLTDIFTFGIFKNNIPYDIIKSTHQTNQFNLNNNQLTMRSNAVCTEDFFVSKTFTSTYEIAEVCNQLTNQIEQYATFTISTPFLASYQSFNNPITLFADNVFHQDWWYGAFNMYPEPLMCQESYNNFRKQVMCG